MCPAWNIVEHFETKMLHFETLRQKSFIFYYNIGIDHNKTQCKKILLCNSLIFNGLEKSLKNFAKKCKKSLEIKKIAVPLQSQSHRNGYGLQSSLSSLANSTK